MCADRPKEEQPKWWSWSWPSRSLVMLCSLAATVRGGERDTTKSGGAVESKVQCSDGGGASRRPQRDPRDRLGL
jgi:hypothetical protein